MQSYNNSAYMYGYCSTFVYMHNFTSTNMGVFFLLKMCKLTAFCILHNFTTSNAVALSLGL